MIFLMKFFLYTFSFQKLSVNDRERCPYWNLSFNDGDGKKFRLVKSTVFPCLVNLTGTGKWWWIVKIDFCAWAMLLLQPCHVKIEDDVIIQNISQPLSIYQPIILLNKTMRCSVWWHHFLFFVKYSSNILLQTHPISFMPLSSDESTVDIHSTPL